MAHYAYISNAEFTGTERARIDAIDNEINSICGSNRDSEGYKLLNDVLETKYTSDTLKQLELELKELELASDEYNSKLLEIQTEKEKIEKERLEIIDQLHELEYNDTEDLFAEKETLETTIANALCRVTKVIVGNDEIDYINGDSTEIDAEIKALEESRNGKSKEDIIAIEQEIQNKLEEKNNIPKIEVDNTVYWEAYYGETKRTSYNSNIRKNFAGKGMIYDPVRDAFYAEQPYPSWTLNEETYIWEPPTPKPEGEYNWKEDTTEWVDYAYINPDNNQPYPSWVWDTTNGGWNAPVEKPDDGKRYAWDEETLNWIEFI